MQPNWLSNIYIITQNIPVQSPTIKSKDEEHNKDWINMSVQ